ncbi:MAG: type II toxin-antitoxin system PemK/MazF family toxin [Ruminococcus sp.]|nr:type II toxin-antitoxin system PemK/MazF family toxin [Ruminococcus sp.]
MNKRKVYRGDIFLYDFGNSTGPIQNGFRPVLVLQADNFNSKSPTIIVAAITTAIRKSYLPSHLVIGERYGLAEPSMVMLEQLYPANKDDLKECIGHISDDNLNRKIHIALKQVFGYWDYYRKNTANIRCLCSKHLDEYKSVSEFIVRRVDPLTNEKDKCDKCQSYGYDYFVFSRERGVKSVR